jgi:hypothetical protein
MDITGMMQKISPRVKILDEEEAYMYLKFKKLEKDIRKLKV